MHWRPTRRRRAGRGGAGVGVAPSLPLAGEVTT